MGSSSHNRQYGTDTLGGQSQTGAACSSASDANPPIGAYDPKVRVPAKPQIQTEMLTTFESLPSFRVSTAMEKTRYRQASAALDRSRKGFSDARRHEKNRREKNRRLRGARSFHGGDFLRGRDPRGGARAGADAAGLWPSQRGLHRMDERLRRLPSPAASARARRQALVPPGPDQFRVLNARHRLPARRSRLPAEEAIVAPRPGSRLPRVSPT